MEALKNKTAVAERVRTYDRYKDSGVEWLGEIPEHWEVKRFKFLAEAKKGRLPNKIVSINDDHLPPYMSMEYLRGGEENQWVKDSDALIIDKDEILLLWDGSNSGEFLKSRKGVISSTVAHIIFKDIDKNFAWYHSKVLEIELRKNTIGMGIPHVNGRVLNNLIVLLPPLPEQTAIAQFLDDKTTKIDQAIGIKEQQISLLKERKQILIHNAVTKGIRPLSEVKMKDSGVEWIGEIPEEWEVKKIKHVTNKTGSGITPSGGGTTYLDEGIPLLRSQNIFFDKIELEGVAFISEKTHASMSNSQVHKGDVLLNITGGSIGRCYFVDIDMPLNVNQHVCIVRPNKKITTLFLNSVLSSKVGQNQIWYHQQGGGREGLNFQALKNFDIPYPALSEQKEISAYIKTASEKIDNAIDLKHQEIEKLKEYKSSLINSVVTGKVRVS